MYNRVLYLALRSGVISYLIVISKYFVDGIKSWLHLQNKQLKNNIFFFCLNVFSFNATRPLNQSTMVKMGGQKKAKICQRSCRASSDINIKL